MKIKFAHLKERSTNGSYISFVVFDVATRTKSNADNDEVLTQLTSMVRAQGLRVDQSALQYRRGSKLEFYGSRNLVKYLSKHGVSHWTHSMSV